MARFEEASRCTQLSSQVEREQVAGNVKSADRSLSRVHHVKEQVASYFNALPRKIQGLLQAILRSQFQSYQLLLKVQRDISQRPTNALESNIKFEDVLGETQYLPYEFFRHWEVSFKPELS